MTGVFLGYEDEIITDQIDLSYLINKIGGIPNWPITGLEFDSKCVVCGFPRPLVLQCYAPLLESSYHRTLYVFGCINSSCWNNSNSWSCYRSQHIDKSYDSNSIKPKDEKLKATVASDPWCSGADEWGDDEGIADSPTTEVFSDPSFQHQTTNNIDRMSDSDEEESNEMEQIESSVNKISLSNNSEPGVSSESNTGATAQIDGNESEVITDLPTMPDNNIFALLTQVPELPEALIGDNMSIQFDAKYVNVYEEYLEEGKSDHVKQLLDQYEKEHSEDLKKVKVKGKSSKKSEVEEYEKAIPLHGNEVFHNFLTRIQMNPTQILRYCFGGQPLPMSPLPASLRSSKCRHCGGDNWFELQILPTIIPSLRIPNSTSAHLEFGTVLIYTCKKSCWRNNDKILEETIFVQSEPS